MASAEESSRSKRFTSLFKAARSDSASGTGVARRPLGTKSWSAIAALVFIAALLLVILLPLSFTYVTYNQVGLLSSRSSGKIDLGRVYSPGRHYNEPDKKMRTFDVDAKLLGLNGVTVFSADKLEIIMNLTMIYNVQGERVGDVFREYGDRLDTVVERRAVDAIKNSSPRFTTNQFFSARNIVEGSLRASVVERVGDLSVDVSDVLLDTVTMSEKVLEKQLAVAVQLEKNAEEQYSRNATITRTRTEREVAVVANEESVILAEAEADAQLVRDTADAEAAAITLAHRTDGLRYMYDTLGLTDNALKLRFNYVRALRNNKNLKLNLGFTPTKIQSLD